MIMTVGNRFKDEAWDPHAYGKMENLFVVGTWNCDFDNEVKPQAADIILKVRNNFNAFEGTLLQEIIDSKRITRLFVMGYFRNVYVEDTTKEASNLFPDLNLYVLHDGCEEKKQVRIF